MVESAIATINKQKVVAPPFSDCLGPIGKVFVAQAINGKYIDRELLARAVKYMPRVVQEEILSNCPTERSFLC